MVLVNLMVLAISLFIMIAHVDHLRRRVAQAG